MPRGDHQVPGVRQRPGQVARLAGAHVQGVREHDHGERLAIAGGRCPHDHVDSTDARRFLVGRACGYGGQDEHADEQRAQDVQRAEARRHQGR